MKMAKATEEDIKASLLLLGILNDVDGGGYPRGLDGESDPDAPEEFDKDDEQHLRVFYDRVMYCVKVRPSGIDRVVFGFATIMDNDILNPAVSHLELHPRFKDSAEFLEKLYEVRNEPDKMLIMIERYHQAAKQQGPLHG